MPKNMALKGEPRKNMLGVKGGHQRNCFKFCSDGICDNANNLPECQFLEVLIVKNRPFYNVSYIDHVCSLLMAIQNFYFIYLQPL